MKHIKKQNIKSLDNPCLILAKQISMILCLFFSVFLIYLDATGSKQLSKTKMGVYSITTHLFSSSQKISKVMDDFFSNFNTITELNSTIKDLRKENAKVQEWKNDALRYQAENKSLKELLKFTDFKNREFTSTRIAINNASSFKKSVIVHEKDLKTNQTVISAFGLVGRVIESNKDTANVLLITDINSKVPALVERTRQKTIALGEGTNKLSLKYLEKAKNLTVGDRIVTSGDGNVYIPGILIGTVSYIDNDIVKIKPATKFNKLEFVSILKYNKEDAK